MPKLRHAFATTALIFFAIPHALADEQPQPAAKPAATTPAPQADRPLLPLRRQLLHQRRLRHRPSPPLRQLPFSRPK